MPSDLSLLLRPDVGAELSTNELPIAAPLLALVRHENCRMFWWTNCLQAASWHKCLWCNSSSRTDA